MKQRQPPAQLSTTAGCCGYRPRYLLRRAPIQMAERTRRRNTPQALPIAAAKVFARYSSCMSAFKGSSLEPSVSIWEIFTERRSGSNWPRSAESRQTFRVPSRRTLFVLDRLYLSKSTAPTAASAIRPSPIWPGCEAYRRQCRAPPRCDTRAAARARHEGSATGRRSVPAGG